MAIAVPVTAAFAVIGTLVGEVGRGLWDRWAMTE